MVDSKIHQVKLITVAIKIKGSTVVSNYSKIQFYLNITIMYLA